jgi:NADPH:quinone reductase-like Zn-dependent oxidoreductase
MVGKVKPVVDSVFAFEDVLKAFERVMSKRARGKVVVKVDPETE